MQMKERFPIEPLFWRMYSLVANQIYQTSLHTGIKLRDLILPRPRRNQRNIYWLELEPRLVRVGSEIGLGCLQEVLVVALGEVGLIVRAAGLVAQLRTLGDDPRQLQHVIKLAREDERRVRPHGAVAQVHVAEAFEEFH